MTFDDKSESIISKNNFLGNHGHLKMSTPYKETSYITGHIHTTFGIFSEKLWESSQANQHANKLLKL